MKDISLRLGFASLTLFVGVVTVLLIHNFRNSADFTTVNKSDLENATIVRIAPKPPRFTESFRACRPGYVQGYITNDGVELTEGNSGCEKLRKKDRRIIQRDDERVISKIENEDKTRYQIYQFKDGHCINAPTIELALEFEKWQKSQK